MKMNDQVVLVTGANRGLGEALVRAALAAGARRVYAAARDPKTVAEAVKRGEGRVVPLALDVTDAASIAAAAERIRGELGRLDVLVNNAAVAHVGPADASFEQIMQSARPSTAPIDDVRAVFETNVFGVIAVTQALLPLLREAPAGRIVNVSSELGSLTSQSDPANPYRSMASVTYSASKSALNAVTVAFANELADTKIKVNAACPGYTATDLNKFTGHRTVEQAAREPVRLATLDESGPTGSFSNEDGPLRW